MSLPSSGKSAMANVIGFPSGSLPLSTTSVGVFCFTITEVPIAVGGRLPPPVRTPVGQVQGSLRGDCRRGGTDRTGLRWRDGRLRRWSGCSGCRGR